LDRYQLKNLSFKLFLEGVPIPFRSLTVSHNDTTTFNINIPPYYEAFHLESGTNGLLVFRNKSTEEWKMLAEGIYIGNGYSKRPKDRTITLKFKDVKWFYDNTRLYDIIKTSKAFGVIESAFFGDTRYENIDFKKTEVSANADFSARSEFINSFKKDNPITESVNYILENMLNGNEFLNEYVPKYNLDKERFRIIENKKTAEVFQFQVVQNIYNEILNESTTMTRVIDLIYSLAQIIQYDIKPVPGMLNDNPIASYVMKPNLQFTTPPACNVIFPDENTSFNYQKDETQIPTRYRLVDNIYGNESRGYYAPSSIFEGFEKDKGTRGALTDEEKFKGIIPHQTTMPLSQTLSIGFTEGSLEEQVMSKSSFVNYLYYKEKYKTVPLSVEVAFKPDLLPGFPALIMDKEIPLIGYLISSTHNISPESGYATTTLTMSHVRPFTEYFPQLSGWYSEDQFGVNGISDTYAQMGTKGCFDNDLTPNEKGNRFDVTSDGMVSLEKGVRAIQRSYQNQEDRVTFQNKFKRNIATLNQYMEKMDIDMIDGKLEGGPYDIGFEVGEATVSEHRREKVNILKKRMESTSPRRFSKEDK
jgi:hypothetical protein